MNLAGTRRLNLWGDWLYVVRVSLNAPLYTQRHGFEHRGEILRVGMAVRNAMKHSQAERVEVELRQEENGLKLIIADDGRGLSATLLSSKGTGLETMRCRARLVGADLTIASRPAGGTAVNCNLPQKYADKN